MTTDVHLKTDDGFNCLHIAALYGHLNLCKTLVNKHNFDVDMTANSGWSSLHISVVNGSYELVNFFTDMGANIHLKTNDGKNCLHSAALHGHLNLCKMFLDNYKFDVHMSDNNEWRPLHFSAKNGNFELFSYLLDKGSEIYCQTKNMENILYLSAGNGHLKFANLSCSTSLKIIMITTRKINMHYMGISTRVKYSINTTPSFCMLWILMEIHVYI